MATFNFKKTDKENVFLLVRGNKHFGEFTTSFDALNTSFEVDEKDFPTSLTINFDTDPKTSILVLEGAAVEVKSKSDEESTKSDEESTKSDEESTKSDEDSTKKSTSKKDNKEKPTLTQEQKEKTMKNLIEARTAKLSVQDSPVTIKDVLAERRDGQYRTKLEIKRRRQ